MKITLIEPNVSKYSFWKYINLVTFYFKTGLPLLASILKSLGHEVTIYVQARTKIDLKDVISSDAIGITALTASVIPGYKIARTIKKLKPNIPIIMGGPHVTFMADEALDYADFVVRGEGEKTIVELIQALGSGCKSFDSILGLSYWKEGKKTHNPDRELCADLDALPFPDFTAIKGYDHFVKNRSFFSTILTSRGCPFNCKFCSIIQMFGRKFRTRSINNVIEELLLQKRLINSNKIMIWDDNLTVNKERVKSLLEKMLSKNITYDNIYAQVRIDVTEDEELLKLMRKIGTWDLYIGMESINPKTLKLYDKRQTIEEMKGCVHKLQEYNFRVSGHFIVGSDEDTIETIKETINFAKNLNLLYATCFILTPLPGTETRRELLAEGRIFTNNWEYYDDHHITFHPRNCKPYELQDAAYKSLRKFYSFKRGLDILKRYGPVADALTAIPLNIILKLSELDNRSFNKLIKSKS